MEYRVVNKKMENPELLNKVIANMLSEYSKQLYGFTKAEFDAIMEYDVLNIVAFYYSKMNNGQKEAICNALDKSMKLSGMEEILEDLAFFADDMYVPLSCKLMDRLSDTRVTMIVYESLFFACNKLSLDIWYSKDSYSNYLMLLNAAYFNALAYKLHIRDSYKACLSTYYKADGYDELVEALYEKNLDNLGWDENVELDVLEDLIEDSKRNSSIDSSPMDEYSDAVARMAEIKREHFDKIDADGDKEGFELIVQKTGIHEFKCVNIAGFECHFCEAKQTENEYIIVYQKETRISDIIDVEESWKKFQHDLYYEDIKDGNSTGMVYIIYILDKDSSNIPIQVIESNKTYGRKYVFTEEETITFINGIVKTTHEELGAVSPVQEWDRILKEEHLTGCLTEPYSSKKVEAYLQGDRFDADYMYDDDYAMLRHSSVPHVKWVKSLDTKGYRSFCFNDKVMEFGQINLFYGANGSGKTSVLEAIEYALTCEVRRVKDFKVKLPSDKFPKLKIYDREAGVHTFNPEFSKQNCKEIERVWYGVPVGRTKSNLNENFNRFNAFDSEAAYKFIHETDNSEDSYAAMFGNLMFGESVVDHEKKWQRFKKAFNDRYSELREELSSARYMADMYAQLLAQKGEESKSEEIEKALIDLLFATRRALPDEAAQRYKKVFEELALVRKYVELFSAYHLEDKSFSDVSMSVQENKKQNLQCVKEKKDKQDAITRLTEEVGELKKRIFDEKERQSILQDRLNRINVNKRNWSIVQNVLSHTDTIHLVNCLLEELQAIDKELYYISKLEQYPAVVSFLKLDSYETMPEDDYAEQKMLLDELRNRRSQLENRYNEVKKELGIKEQQAVELRKIGKTLLSDAKCPLCGQEYSSIQQISDLIENSVIVNDAIEKLLLEIRSLDDQIAGVEKVVEREQLIIKSMEVLEQLAETIPMIAQSGKNYHKLHEYMLSKVVREKRKAEIIEQQTALDAQGFSLKNINACREYKASDASYLEYKRVGTGTYEEYLEAQLSDIQAKITASETMLLRLEKQVQTNGQKEELLRNEIRRIESIIQNLDMEANREIEQAIEIIGGKFNLIAATPIKVWVAKYHSLYDQCELENERLQSQGSVAFEKQQLAEFRATIKRVEPQVERCAKAVQVFEMMPSLSSFVEKGIKSNIQQISKFFKWMHHSGEFEELGIDGEGIYAIRGLNHEKIRTYQMSTGQRSTIAMSVMFALHMAAPDAPQFLLLDEPLATMDDTQVLNVLDILKSMAEQGTQIFFTTANGIMINLFKECFKNTTFDYKEYQFIKRVNRPSEIRESSVNDAKTIEELTLDDLVLDFNQFAQIRDILRKNQEKLVAKDEWEILGQGTEKKGEVPEMQMVDETDDTTESFYSLLTWEEQKLLDILLNNENSSAPRLREALQAYPHFRIIYERINEKAVDYFGETVVENNDELPWMDSDYLKELKEHQDRFYQK